jgi:hypothetical protein
MIDRVSLIYSRMEVEKSVLKNSKICLVKNYQILTLSS